MQYSLSTIIIVVSIVLGNAIATAADNAGKVKGINVDTPNLCVVVDRVDGEDIYLRSTKKDCEPFAGKLPATVAAGVNTVSLYVDGVFWKKQEAKGFNTDVLLDIQNRSKQNFGNFKVPSNSHAGAGTEQAQDVIAMFKSEAVQERIRQNTEELKSWIFKDQTNRFSAKDEGSNNKAKRLPLKPNERIYVFVSSSVPVTTLRAYGAAIDKIHDPNVQMVVKGFINGYRDRPAMLKFVFGIESINQDCDYRKMKCPKYQANFNIDPLLFAKYGVTSVPTIVYATDVSVVDHEMSEGKDDNAKTGKFYSVRGDASLEYILELIRKETKSPSIENTIAVLEKGFY